MDRFDELLYSVAQARSPRPPQDVVYGKLLRQRHAKNKARARGLRYAAAAAACLALCAGSFLAGKEWMRGWLLTPIPPQTNEPAPGVLINPPKTGDDGPIVDVPQTDGESTVFEYGAVTVFPDLPRAEELGALAFPGLPEGYAFKLSNEAEGEIVDRNGETSFVLAIYGLNGLRADAAAVLGALKPGEGQLLTCRGEDSGELIDISLIVRLTEDAFLELYHASDTPDTNALLALAQGIRTK